MNLIDMHLGSNKIGILYANFITLIYVFNQFHSHEGFCSSNHTHLLIIALVEEVMLNS